MVHGIRRYSPRHEHASKVIHCRTKQLQHKYKAYVEMPSALHVMQTRRKESKDPIAPLYGLLPYFATWALVPIYLYLQPIILHHHLIPFVFYIGLINAYAVGQIIVAHLTKNPEFPMYNVLTLPLALAVVDSLGPPVGVWPSALGFGTYQISYVFLCMGLGVGVYGSFIVSFFFLLGFCAL